MHTSAATYPGDSNPGAPPPVVETVLSFMSVSFCPAAALVSATARLVNDFCQAQFDDPDICYRFRMAAHELAENITKYSSSSRVSLEAELYVSNGQHRLRVRTRNVAEVARLREIEQRLLELKAAPDPMDLYDLLIRETAPIDGVSGLGLVRIRAEGELDIDYRIEGSELTIIVEGNVPAPRLPA